jgi:hypothetical protein
VKKSIPISGLSAMLLGMQVIRLIAAIYPQIILMHFTLPALFMVKQLLHFHARFVKAMQ